MALSFLRQKQQERPLLILLQSGVVPSAQKKSELNIFVLTLM
jgi:hypothetical protein